MKKVVFSEESMEKYFFIKPAQFETFKSEITDMLLELSAQKEDKSVKKKGLSAMLIAAILIVALACTALALTKHFGVLDTLFHFNRDNLEEAMEFVIQDIHQEGGDLERVRFVVQDAIYDGRKVYFSIVAEAKEEGVLPIDVLSMYEDDTFVHHDLAAHAQIKVVEVLGVYCEASVFFNGENTDGDADGLRWIPYGSRTEENFYICTYDALLPTGISPETLTVECSIGYASSYQEYLDGEYTHGTITFEIPKKEASSTVIDIDLDLEFYGSHLEHISLIHTPIELTVLITGTGEPNLHHDYWLIQEDGYPYSFSRLGGEVDDDGNLVSGGSFAADKQMPEIITLWRYGVNAALVIDVKTGSASVHPADIMADGRIIVHYDEAY